MIDIKDVYEFLRQVRITRDPTRGASTPAHIFTPHPLLLGELANPASSESLNGGMDHFMIACHRRLLQYLIQGGRDRHASRMAGLLAQAGRIVDWRRHEVADEPRRPLQHCLKMLTQERPSRNAALLCSAAQKPLLHRLIDAPSPAPLRLFGAQILFVHNAPGYLLLCELTEICLALYQPLAINRETTDTGTANPTCTISVDIAPDNAARLIAITHAPTQ